MTADFRAEVEALRPQLLRYATLELRDRDRAEDCVQETLLAALSGEAKFEGRSNLRTWLTGILKHKIIDTIRRSSRERTLDGEAEDGVSEFDRLFDERGHWREFPPEWSEPDGALEQKQFMQALERCLATLPQRTAQTFMLREHMGLETAEICQQLGLTASHCWVLLYRARMALRECLEKHWFKK